MPAVRRSQIAILDFLATSPDGADVTAIAAARGLSQPNISHSLSLIRLGGLAEVERRGKRRIYRITSHGRDVATAHGRLAELTS